MATTKSRRVIQGQVRVFAVWRACAGTAEATRNPPQQPRLVGEDAWQQTRQTCQGCRQPCARARSLATSCPEPSAPQCCPVTKTAHDHRHIVDLSTHSCGPVLARIYLTSKVRHLCLVQIPRTTPQISTIASTSHHVDLSPTPLNARLQGTRSDEICHRTLRLKSRSVCRLTLLPGSLPRPLPTMS